MRCSRCRLLLPLLTRSGIVPKSVVAKSIIPKAIIAKSIIPKAWESASISIKGVSWSVVERASAKGSWTAIIILIGVSAIEGISTASSVIKSPTPELGVSPMIVVMICYSPRPSKLVINTIGVLSRITVVVVVVARPLREKPSLTLNDGALQNQEAANCSGNYCKL